MFTSNVTWTEQALFRDMYAYAHRYSHLITKKLSKKRHHELQNKKGHMGHFRGRNRNREML